MAADGKWDTTGLDKMLARLAELEKREVRYGFFETAKYNKKNDRLQVAEVAWRNNYGFANSPARPFFTTHALRILAIGDPVNVKITFHLKSVATDAIFYTSKYRATNLKKMGVALQQSLQEEILDWATPPNAKKTIAKKGFDDPLIHTGKMYDSVKAKIVTKLGEDDA